MIARSVSTVVISAVLFVTGCHGSEQTKESPSPAVNSAAVAGKDNPELKGQIEGTVIQTLAAGRYLYIELKTGTGSVWVAAATDSVATGASVGCSIQLLMEKFESPILKRTFDRVYFVSLLPKPMDMTAMPTNHPSIQDMHSTKPADTAGMKVDVSKADGGVTIAEIAAGKEKLKGTSVLLRGKVTKYNSDILGANWLRVRDASDKRDIAVTTKAEVKVGDTVLIRGNLECDVNLGSGYSYDLIIRNAEVTAEKTAQP